MAIKVVVPFLVLVGCVWGTAASSDTRPNVIVLLTDDQDALLNSTTFQHALMEKVKSKGMSFARGFANTPVCCPSRSSLLTGKYTHNHGALNNSISGSCASPSWSANMEPDALAPHLQKAGYKTIYMGKYLNNYGLNGSGGPGGKKGIAYVPPGWTEWYTLQGNSRYYNYTISNNGVAEKHGDDYEKDYLTDVLKRRAEKFLDESLVSSAQRAMKPNMDRQPFFMWIGTPAAHASFTPAPQYEGTAKGERAPRTPTWNKVYKDRHSTVRDHPPMNKTQIEQSDRIFAQRLGTLRSVDDMVGSIYAKLEEAGEADNTFFFYTGDHGFHLGQLGMGFDKRQLYETDTRVPYFVRGPGVPSDVTSNAPISHSD